MGKLRYGVSDGGDKFGRWGEYWDGLVGVVGVVVKKGGEGCNGGGW